MHTLESVSGYEFVVSDEGIRVGGGGLHALARESLSWDEAEVLWRYFDDPDAALADGTVVSWTRPYFFTFDDRGTVSGIELTGHNKAIDSDFLTAFEELYEQLDGSPAKSLWEHQLWSTARAMLAVDRTEEEVEKVWSDATRRARWIERARAAHASIDQPER